MDGGIRPEQLRTDGKIDNESLPVVDKKFTFRCLVAIEFLVVFGKHCCFWNSYFSFVAWLIPQRPRRTLYKGSFHMLMLTN